MNRRKWISNALATAVFAGAASMGSVAVAADYPSRPITVVIPYAPGGATDTLGRLISEALSAELKQTVIVDNKPGGNTGIGASTVGRAQPDGYTVLFTNDATFLLNPAVFKTLSYDMEKDLTPVGTVCYLNLGLVVSASNKANTLEEFMAQTKQQSGKIAYGSYGVGSQAHFMGEIYKKLTDTDITHVPYKGSAPAVVDVIGGQVEFTFPALVTVKGHVEGNRVKVLAISGEERSALLPDVPTFTEAGYPDLNIGAWYGFFAPAGTPDDIVNKLNAALGKIVDSPDFQKKLEAQGTVPLKMTPQEMKDRIKTESAKIQEIAKMANITVD